MSATTTQGKARSEAIARINKRQQQRNRYTNIGPREIRLELNRVNARLKYLRAELRAERISYGELSELQDLAVFIPLHDVELREAAGLPEFAEEWSGSPCPRDPDNFWIDDDTNERVNALTGERTAPR